MSGLTIAVFGLFLMLTPAIVFVASGGRNSGDVITWMMRQSIKHIVMFQACILGGMGLLTCGLMIHAASMGAHQ